MACEICMTCSETRCAAGDVLRVLGLLAGGARDLGDLAARPRRAADRLEGVAGDARAQRSSSTLRIASAIALPPRPNRPARRIISPICFTLALVRCAGS
jgi:hypothetical protein